MNSIQAIEKLALVSVSSIVTLTMATDYGYWILNTYDKNAYHDRTRTNKKELIPKQKKK